MPGVPCDLTHLPGPPTEPIVIVSLPPWLRGRKAAASGRVPLKREAAAAGQMLMLMAARDVDRKQFSRLVTMVENGEGGVVDGAHRPGGRRGGKGGGVNEA
jgi:hypothetical protein